MVFRRSIPWTFNTLAGRQHASFAIRSTLSMRMSVSARLATPSRPFQRRTICQGGVPFNKAHSLISDDVVNDEEEFDFFGDEEYTESDLESLDLKMIHEDRNGEKSSIFPAGVQDGFYIVMQYSVPARFQLANNPQLAATDIQRLKVAPDNTTLPVALLLLDPEEYPTLSRARRACRKGSIVIHRGALPAHGVILDSTMWARANVGDRVYPGDVIGKQVRTSHGSYSELLSYSSRPSFHLPVIYEDDHCAIVNKPSGVLMYSPRDIHQGRHNLRFALPYFVSPPKKSTRSVLIRPTCCHRIDKPTSGLVVVAKTMPALVDITRQFEVRQVKKTYTAIVNGMIHGTPANFLSSREARDMGVDVDADDDSQWQLTKTLLNDKEAVTIWRKLESFNSSKARDQCVTLVELKPKTGRFHQLRRQMADLNSPIIGDTTYGTPLDNLRWGRGLMLCSNKVTLQHPYFNTEEGRIEWEQLDHETKYKSGMLGMCEDNDSVLVNVSIDLPKKFHRVLARV